MLAMLMLAMLMLTMLIYYLHFIPKNFTVFVSTPNIICNMIPKINDIIVVITRGIVVIYVINIANNIVKI